MARATLVGSMSDSSPWDHLDYAGKHLTPVRGTIEIDVHELVNIGAHAGGFVGSIDATPKLCPHILGT
jgi:hypothetical protein